MVRLSLFLLVLLAVGCTREKPSVETVAVSGKVVYRDGKPFSGGSIQFRSQADPNLLTSGVISSTGKYELFTKVKQQRLLGVPVGTYRVIIMPKTDPEQASAPITLRQPAQIAESQSNLDFELESFGP